MFAVLVFEKEPLMLPDVPDAVQTWLFAAGGLAAGALMIWLLAYAIAITGTGVSDFLHLDVHIPYAGTTLLWAVILAAILYAWHRSDGTL